MLRQDTLNREIGWIYFPGGLYVIWRAFRTMSDFYDTRQVNQI